MAKARQGRRTLCRRCRGLQTSDEEQWCLPHDLEDPRACSRTRSSDPPRGCSPNLLMESCSVLASHPLELPLQDSRLLKANTTADKTLWILRTESIPKLAHLPAQEYRGHRLRVLKSRFRGSLERNDVGIVYLKQCTAMFTRP